jgi:hypothetical protein
MGAGLVLAVVGIGMTRKEQTGGLGLRNLGINFGGKNNQSIRTGNIRLAERKDKPNWIGLATTVIGLLTAIVSFFTKY